MATWHLYVKIDFSFLHSALLALNPQKPPMASSQMRAGLLRLIQKKQEAASCKLEQTRHGLVFGVNFTENSGVEAQGKYNNQPPHS